MNCLALLDFSFFNSRIVKITGRMTWDITGDNGQKTLNSGISFLQRVGACPFFFLEGFLFSSLKLREGAAEFLHGSSQPFPFSQPATVT